jgi:hypothetical protein
MNAVPGLRFPVQTGLPAFGREPDPRASTPVNVAPLRQMRDASAQAHQRGVSVTVAPAIRATARIQSVRFLRRNAHALEGAGQPDSFS